MRLVAAVIVAALTPATAAASIRQDVELANHVWHSPCGGVITVYRIHNDDHTVGIANADRRFRPYRDCSVGVNVSLIRFIAGNPVVARELVCEVVLHEFGHESGMPHSRNPRSVMFPYLIGVDPRCKRLIQGGPS